MIISQKTQEAKQEVQNFIERHLLSKKEVSFQEKWRKCGEFGILSLPFPKEYGGLESSLEELAVTIEALGEFYPDRGFTFSLCAHLFACSIPLWKFGDENQKEQFLRPMISGKMIAANAMTEPDTGSDAFSLQTTAKKISGGYVLNGSKTYSSNAPLADTIICYAKTSPNLGYFGITAFALPSNLEGLKVGNEFTKTGLKSSPMAPVYFDDCFVSEEYRIGREGNGARIFEVSMSWERTFLFALYVGMMGKQLQKCLKQTQERTQFGKKIVEYQAISHRLVDMKIRWETSRLLLYQAVDSLAKDAPSHTLDSCIAKIYISEMAILSSLDAVQIHGGQGVVSEGGIDSMLYDALPSRIFSGTNEIMREKIIQELLNSRI